METVTKKHGTTSNFYYLSLRFHSMIMVKRPADVVHVFKYLFTDNKTRCEKEGRDLYHSKSGRLNSLDNVKYFPNITEIQ